MREASDVTQPGTTDAARAELLLEALADFNVRATDTPGAADDAWHDLVTALARTHGDSEAYDQLRAVEIRPRTSRRR